MAVELRVPGGRLPVLLTAVVSGDRVHAAISSARDRMSYERELLAARVAAEGLLAVVVGDVVGRGLAAASAMGQLRSAVRAVAGPDVGPARLLTRLDRFVEQVEAAGMSTLAYAELDLATGVLRYACAGHPPPLLLRTGQDAELLWEGRSTPLGGFVRPLERSEAEVQLVAGDRLMLYTDGIFERRDRELDEGLELVALATQGSEGAPLDETVQSLTRHRQRRRAHGRDHRGHGRRACGGPGPVGGDVLRQRRGAAHRPAGSRLRPQRRGLPGRRSRARRILDLVGLGDVLACEDLDAAVAALLQRACPDC